MAVKTNLPAEGHIGVEPPADAPREVAQPLTDEFVAESAAKARVNERTLAPLNYLKKGPVVEGELSHEPREPEPVQEAPNYPQSAETRPSKFVDAAVKEEFPAASNTDSPSRGIPGTTPIPAARKKAPLGITGGFGEQEGEYYPIDGRELKSIVEHLLGEVFDQIQNDMRFGLARTFPNIDVHLTLEVNCVEQDKPLVIEKRRREFNDRGESELPPDAMRQEIGLARPRKQRMPGPAGQVADVAW